MDLNLYRAFFILCVNIVAIMRPHLSKIMMQCLSKVHVVVTDILDVSLVKKT